MPRTKVQFPVAVSTRITREQAKLLAKVGRKLRVSPAAALRAILAEWLEGWGQR